MTTILALDLGLHTGWALYQAGKIKSGSLDLTPTKYQSVNRRFVNLRRWLEEQHKLDLMGLTLIFFEAVQKHSATYAAHAYGGFMATLTAFCEENGVEYEGVGVGTIKSFVLKKAAISKDKKSGKTLIEKHKKDTKMIVIKAIQKLGYNPKDDNEADAIALLLFGLDKEKIAK